MDGARVTVRAFESGNVMYARCPFCELLVTVDSGSCPHVRVLMESGGINQMEFQRVTASQVVVVVRKSAAAAAAVWIVFAGASVGRINGTTAYDERSIRTEQRVLDAERRLAGVEGLIERVARLESAVNTSSQYQLAVGSGVAVLVAQQLMSLFTKRK